jgi:hypothetical protein
MSTRATIKFSDGDDEFFVYRHHDGYPEGNIIPDIEKTLNLIMGRWSEPELEFLVTSFLIVGNDLQKSRTPNYRITSCIHGDESYLYFVSWDDDKNEWIYGVEE